MDKNLHIMRERDVGLFSLVQQVIGNVPWAEAEGRVPVAYFGPRCSYFKAGGHRGRDTVWEYYFEPVVSGYPWSLVPTDLAARVEPVSPGDVDLGVALDGGHFVSRHFGDHADLAGKSLPVPYLWDDPSPELRRRAAGIIKAHVRPRRYIIEAALAFRAKHLPERFIGVHVRGTDAISRDERRLHRLGSLSFPQFKRAIEDALRVRPDAALFVATDSERSLEQVRSWFGDRVRAYDSLRHHDGPAAGRGPAGGLIPAYVSASPDAAARNGEEALIEYCLLCQSSLLIHNGSGLARTVLLTRPDLGHVNTHLARTYWVFAFRNAQRCLHFYRRIRGMK